MAPVAQHTKLLTAARASRPAGRVTPADCLFRAATADAIRHVKPGGAEAALATMFGEDEGSLAVLRAATGPATTTTTGWAAELVQTALGDFVAGLAPKSAAASLFQLASPLTFERGVGKLFLPVIDTAATAHWVSELSPIPVTSAALANVTLEPRKLAAICGLSEESLKRLTAEAVVRMALSEAAATALDSALFDDTAASTARPAGLLAGVTPLVGLGGGDQTALIADITALVGAVSAVSGGRIALIMHPTKAVTLSILAPQLALPVLTTAHIAATTIIAVAIPALAVAVGEIEIDTSREATIHMSTTPAELVTDGGVVADPTRSYWQTDSICIRLLMNVSWTLRAAGAVAVVENASW